MSDQNVNLTSKKNHSLVVLTSYDLLSLTKQNWSKKTLGSWVLLITMGEILSEQWLGSMLLWQSEIK